MKFLYAQFCKSSRLGSLSCDKYVLPVHSYIIKEQLLLATLHPSNTRVVVDMSPTSPWHLPQNYEHFLNVAITLSLRAFLGCRKMLSPHVGKTDLGSLWPQETPSTNDTQELTASSLFTWDISDTGFTHPRGPTAITCSLTHLENELASFPSLPHFPTPLLMLPGLPYN